MSRSFLRAAIERALDAAGPHSGRTTRWYRTDGGQLTIRALGCSVQEAEAVNDMDAGLDAVMRGDERQAIADFLAARDAYRKARADLVSQQDRLEVELQTAEANLSQYQEDKAQGLE